MFEDVAGGERIWLHAERDLTTEVEANELHTVDGDRNTVIAGNDTLTVMTASTSTTKGKDTEILMGGADRNGTGGVTEKYKGAEKARCTWHCIKTKLRIIV